MSRRLRAITPTPTSPLSISHTDAGSGTGLTPPSASIAASVTVLSVAPAAAGLNEGSTSRQATGSLLPLHVGYALQPVKTKSRVCVVPDDGCTLIEKDPSTVSDSEPKYAPSPSTATATAPKAATVPLILIGPLFADVVNVTPQSWTPLPPA